MTGDLQEIPYHELDRIHQQAKEGLHWATLSGRETIYRKSERMEKKARYEKIRRARERAGPEVSIR